MTTSDKKINANRINGKKSHGPIDTRSSRFNAMKHGLLALGITDLDDAEGYQAILLDLIQGKKPVGILEKKLVEAAALDIVRWARARRLEAEYITAMLNPPHYEKNLLDDFDSKLQGAMLDPGIPASLGARNVQHLVVFFQRYESSFANRLFRTLHELERLQRMRQGERLPAPTAVDVSVRLKTETPESVPVEAQQEKEVLSRDGESLPTPDTTDIIHAKDIIHANAEAAESTLAEAEQERILPAGGEDSSGLSSVDRGNDETGVVEAAPVAPPVSWKPRAIGAEGMWNKR